MSKKKESVTRGNHLTVTASPNGQVKLEWDWDALTEEIKQATNLVSATEAKVSKSRNKRV